MLRIENLFKSYKTESGRLKVLRGVDFELAGGDMLAITGESGSGKSTLLHLIAALDTFDKGEISIGDRKLSQLDEKGRAAIRRRTVGIVFQQFNLVPSLDVWDNLSLQARLADRFDPARTDSLVDALGLREHVRRFPEQLSGGQQQRVAIGRALAASPEIVLADEPTGNLDEKTAGEVFSLMTDLAAETRCTLIIVTHSQKMASELPNRLHLKEGRLA